MILSRLFNQIWVITYKLPNQSGGLIATAKTKKEVIDKMFSLLLDNK